MKPGVVAVLVIGVAFGAGYLIKPDRLDESVRQHGFFVVERRKTLFAAVDSLREESRLQVLVYRGTVKVRASKTLLWLFDGEQTLWVPASVPLLIDLGKMVVTFDGGKIVRVKIPAPTLGDIAFQVEEALSVRGGALSWSQSQRDALEKEAYATARTAFVVQAQGFRPFAERQARAVIERQLHKTLPDLIVEFE